MCTFASIGWAQNNQEHRAIIDSIYSEVLMETRVINIKLPESYIENTGMTYPVAYILDGEVFLSTASLVHGYYSGGFMPETIFVGISNTTNRTRDLTTSELSERRGVAYQQESGGADQFVKFIENELIDYVEKKYPVTSYRTLIGHSYGGLFTINTLINHSHLFENYLAIDPSLDWDDQKLLKQAKEVLPNKNLKGKSLFISLSGQLHMQDPDITIKNIMQDSTEFTLFARSNIEFSKLAETNAANGLVTDWKFYPNDLHGTIPLPSMIDGLISLFEWFQMENTSKFNNPETAKEVLEEVVKHREKKLESNFGYRVPPYEESLFNMLGYMNMEMGNMDKSLMFFEMAINYYPNSANSYDSLADYYAAVNDFGNALKFVSKAYEISQEEYHKKRITEFKSKL